MDLLQNGAYSERIIDVVDNEIQNAEPVIQFKQLAGSSYVKKTQPAYLKVHTMYTVIYPLAMMRCDLL